METKISSVSQYIDAIVNLRFTNQDSDNRYLWFRGDGSVNWDTPLVPIAYRKLAKQLINTDNDTFFLKI